MKKHPTGGELSVARSTGFEPAISSVTGRRDRPTSLRAHVNIPYIIRLLLSFQGKCLLFSLDYFTISV